MRTKNELIQRYNFLIEEEEKKGWKYGEINRYKRIIQISKGIDPIELRQLKNKNNVFMTAKNIYERAKELNKNLDWSIDLIKHFARNETEHQEIKDKLTRKFKNQ